MQVLLLNSTRKPLSFCWSSRQLARTLYLVLLFTLLNSEKNYNIPIRLGIPLPIPSSTYQAALASPWLSDINGHSLSSFSSTDAALFSFAEWSLFSRWVEQRVLFKPQNQTMSEPGLNELFKWPGPELELDEASRLNAWFDAPVVLPAN